MKANGDVEVLFRTGSGDTKVLGVGVLANGGFLHVEFSLADPPAGTLLLRNIRCNQHDPSYKIEKLILKSVVLEKGKKCGKGIFLYHVSLSIDKP